MKKNICIFCKSNDGPFKSREHIVPESLGNDKAILERGIVCDTCNHGQLSLVDGYLLSSHYISVARTLFNVPNKTGVVPETRTGNIHMKRMKSEGVRVEIPNYKKKHSEWSLKADGTVEFKMRLIGKRQTVQESRKLARALYKIGLELIAYNEGAEVALDSKYDEIRDIVLDKKADFHGYIVVQAVKTAPICRLRYETFYNDKNDPLEVFLLNFYGQQFLFDMTERKILESEVSSLKARKISVLEW